VDPVQRGTQLDLRADAGGGLPLIISDKRGLGSAAAVILAWAGPLQEREPAQPRPVIGTTVEVVQVDAVVLDSDGRYVTDLEASDFEIFEDGRQQQISNCTYIAPEPSPEARPTTPPSVHLPERQAVRRTMALVIDDLGLSFDSVSRMRTALHDFVDRQMLPGDLVAIVRTAAGMGALQQFTSDRRMLHAAVDGIRFNIATRGTVAAFTMPGPHGGGESGGSAGGGAAAAMAAFGAGMQAFEAARERDRQRYLTVGSLGAVRFVLGGMLRMPGRKSIVLVSEGFAMYDEDGERSRFTEAIRTLTDLANRASVVIYSFDPRGLLTLGATAASLASEGSAAANLASRSAVIEMRSGLSSLATDTGGLLLADTNDLNGAITRILDDQRGYYLIGYTPDPAASRLDQAGPAYHRIKLGTRRPGLRVRSRRGFYPMSASEAEVAPTDPVQRLVDAAQSPFSASDLALRLTTIFEHEKERGSFVRSLLHLETRGLTFTDRPDGSREAEIQLVTLVFGGDGRAVESAGRQHRLGIPADAFEATLRGGLVYSFETPVPRPGGYQVRAAVQDSASTRLGSASQFVEVPEIKKGRLVLSGIAMSGDAAAEETDPETTAAVRRFRPGTLVTYAFFAYNARPSLEVRATVSRDTVPVYQPVAWAFDGAGEPDPTRLAVVGRLALGPELEPGAYSLEVAVTESNHGGKGRTARQWTDFEIVAP
jgi:VWFA-related protein